VNEHERQYLGEIPRRNADGTYNKIGKQIYLGRRMYVVVADLERERECHRSHAEWLAHSAERALIEQRCARRRAHRQTRRTRITNAGGHFTASDLYRIYAEQKGCCIYCAVELRGDYHADHKLPVARGGTSWPDNIACACGPCNLRKHTRTAEEFAEILAREIRLA